MSRAFNRPSIFVSAAAALVAVGGAASLARAQGPSIPLSAAAQASGAQISYSQGIEFVTIGALGNGSYQAADTRQRVHNRGTVNEEFRIGRMEVTTAQWAEFFNAAFDRPTTDRIPHLIPPDFWGARSTTPTVTGGLRWRVPAGSENIPVGDISWRMAAIYCNWLHNDKRTDRAAFLDGAYDVSTFRFVLPFTFTDQATRHPGARFFIPSWDQWLKAAHFDPNRNGPGQGGWWNTSITSDETPAYGPPGTDFAGPLAQANAGWNEFSRPGFDPFAVPLGAYPTVQSPWGLLDTAGGSGEWTEGIITTNTRERYRISDGSFRAQDSFSSALADGIIDQAGEFPHVATFEYGLRIAAAAVPPPGTVVLGLLGLGWSARRKRS